MQCEELAELVKSIAVQHVERSDLELKSALHGFPKIYDTLSSFSNQDNGGIILFGISESSYAVTGVYDAKDLQRRIMEACNEMEPKVRPVITIGCIEGKQVVSAEITGVSFAERPVFHVARGRLNGAYVRVGDADEHMTEYEIYNFETFRRRIRDDRRLAEGESIKSLDQAQLAIYINMIKKLKPHMAASLTDNEIMERLGIMDNGVPTVAGLMVFGEYPQTCFPQFSVTAVLVPGTTMGAIGSLNTERFTANMRIKGTIAEMLEGAVAFVQHNCRSKTIITDDGRRIDKLEYPMVAIREAVLNALMHRDYSVYSENIAIGIEMYNDRIEIKSPGCLLDASSLEQIGQRRLETRNALLANMLEDLHIAENRFSGIPTIRRECAAHGLPVPRFMVRHGEFIVILYNENHRYTETSVSASYAQRTRGNRLEVHEAAKKYKLSKQRALTGARISQQMSFDLITEFCSTPRSAVEIAAYIGKDRRYVAAVILKKMLQAGLLDRTVPNKPNSKNQRYVASFKDM